MLFERGQCSTTSSRIECGLVECERNDSNTGGMPVTTPLRTPAECVSELEEFPDELARAIFDGHDLEALTEPASDGGWGVVEILPHLRDWEEIYLQRIRRIVEEDQPRLPGFDDSLWSIERDYRGQDPEETFASFQQLRGQTVEFLRPLPPEAWLRMAEHGTYGEISLQWLANHICDHDREHLRQARDALAG
jgi:uncharacterized damage-inducible protein DinB